MQRNLSHTSTRTPCRFYAVQENNLVNVLSPTGVFWGDGDERPFKPTYNYQVMLWVLAVIALWMLVARYLFYRRIFITI